MSANSPAISVIIPLYNAKKYIEQAVDSVLDQTFKDVNVLVIDDCSTDGSYELVQSRYGDNERVTLMRNRKNVGPIRNYDIGIFMATGKYVAILDNDDVYLPNALETLYALAERQGADVVSSFGFLHAHSEDIPRNFSGTFVPEISGTPTNQITVITPPQKIFRLSSTSTYRESTDYGALGINYT